MPLWNIPGPFFFHGGCALAKSLVYRGQWLGDENQTTTPMHLDFRSKRRRQADVRPPLSARKRGGGPLRQCRSHSQRPVALETGNRRHSGGPNGIGGIGSSRGWPG